MRISTIIPAFNCAPFLRRAVESVIATQYPNLEIVIVDDGSRDGTLTLANQLRDEFPAIIKVNTHPANENCGVSASRNLGMQSSTGELLAFLDADDYVHPWRFDSAAELLRRRPDVDAVHQLCQLDLAEEKDPHFWNEQNLMFGFPSPIPSDQVLFELLRGLCWATSAILFRRRVLSEAGMFDSRLRLSEDCHFYMRLATCGKVESGDLNRPVSVYCRRAGSAYQPSPWQRIQMIRAMAMFYKWMCRRDPRDPRRSRVSSCIAAYILNGITMARISGNRSLAWQTASKGAVWFPPVLKYKQFYGHVARLPLHR